MKQILISMLCGVVMIVVVIFGNRAYGIQENTLYSQEILNIKQTGESASDSYKTREEAVQIAYKAFGEGLGISLMDYDLSMNMNLYSEGGRRENTYKWAMDWTRDMMLDTYSCTINAMDGQITSLYVAHSTDGTSSVVGEEISEKRVHKVMKRFLTAIGKEIDDYDVELKNKRESMWRQTINVYILENKNNKRDRFLIEIDRSTCEIISFDYNTGEDQ